ncbi:MAG: aromatic ring-hydroxylating dioxygenase subunit alpha [Deltaproteobacteria bacterium]|nr:MAG: aromatic ring-hydroxylating dioxygenase subunit alpha [Deltaproteobacteria bacterium]
MTIVSTKHTKTFAQRDQLVQGWTWAVTSKELGRGQVKGVRLLGRDLVIWRGEDGVARAADAHCPHMGAHLKEGRVDGNGIRCFFHDWRFDAEGHLDDVPCLDRAPEAKLKMWPVAETLGLVWVWPGDEPTRKPPYVPELEDDECDVHVLPTFTERCHPNVMLINAIDEHHFNSVHSLPVDLYMSTDVVDDTTIEFANTTSPKEAHRFARVLQPFYSGPLTYKMCYHHGNTGAVTVGPDLAHFHILFALRMTDDGGTEGRRVLVTRRRKGLRGKLLTKAMLALTNVVGDYFADGDSQVFESIRFDFAVPTKADHAIIDFVRHVEAQPAVRFGEWTAA